MNKRIPWANEPACGACHTGDAVNYLTGNSNLIESPDGIRLLQAYRTNDPNAKPVVPTNQRFAENRTTSSGGDMVTALYRLSKGHKGVFCEACHGSTHAEWPNANPFANDNVTATQLQGHTGVIIECATCHEGDFEQENLLDGPHGMHPVGNDGGYSATWSDQHEDFIEKSGGENVQNLTTKCGTCHGTQGEGTVLAKVQVDRTFTIEECEKGTLCLGGEVKDFQVNLKKGDLVSCKLCHENPFSDSDEEEHDEKERDKD